VGFQELKTEEDQFPREELESEGYSALVLGQKGWNGVAILARRELGEIRERTRGLAGQEDFGARVLAADVGGVTFVTVYVPNGKSVAHEDFPRKLDWLDALGNWIERDLSANGSNVVVGGDFNVCPAALDSWNEKKLLGTLFHTLEERARIDRLRHLGLHDLFREKHPDTAAFSWWDYRAGDFHQGRGLRIDLLWGTASVLQRVTTVEIDREWRKKKEGHTPSDHAPVLAEVTN
jgi:exodeoxyribonuclease-3